LENIGILGFLRDENGRVKWIQLNFKSDQYS
jgi:hypothetical protein